MSYHTGPHTVINGVRATDERSVGNFDSYGDKLETLCLVTLLATFSLGYVTSLAKPADVSAASAIVSLLAIGCLLAPVVGAWYFHKQQEEAEQGSEQTEEPVRADQPVGRDSNPLSDIASQCR